MRTFTRASQASFRLAVTDLSTANGGEGGTKKAQGSLATPLVRIGKIILKIVMSLSNLLHTQ
jgi:hypothetical protein